MTIHSDHQTHKSDLHMHNYLKTILLNQQRNKSETEKLNTEKNSAF